MSESVVLPKFDPFWTPLIAVNAKAQLALDDAVTALNLLHGVISIIGAGSGVIYVPHSNGTQKVPLRITGSPGHYEIEFGDPEPA